MIGEEKKELGRKIPTLGEKPELETKKTLSSFLGLKKTFEGEKEREKKR